MKTSISVQEKISNIRELIIPMLRSSDNDMKTLASDRNYLNSNLFYKVVDIDYKLCFDSLYDISDIDIPSFEQFCNYTGVDYLEPEVAISIYNKQFNL